MGRKLRIETNETEIKKMIQRTNEYRSQFFTNANKNQHTLGPTNQIKILLKFKESEINR